MDYLLLLGLVVGSRGCIAGSSTEEACSFVEEGHWQLLAEERIGLLSSLIVLGRVGGVELLRELRPVVALWVLTQETCKLLLAAPPLVGIGGSTVASVVQVLLGDDIIDRAV